MKQRPRILMIAPLPPPVHGSALMSKYIKDSDVINHNFRLDWINLSTSRSMEEIGKTSPKKIIRFVGSYFKMLLKLFTNKYDACYIALTCHGNGFLKDAPFALLCKLFGRRLIIHQHNKGMSTDVDKPLFKHLFKWVYNNSKVILLSDRLYLDIAQIVDKQQVYICPNGIPPTINYPKNNEPHVPQLLFLSNLIESKGVIVLLDACKKLKDQGYDFKCKFVGGETKEIDSSRFNEEVKKRSLEEFVEYVGKKYGEDKDKEFAASDIFVFPTYNETFGLVILEAMQQGTPIVTTNVGGIPDIIEDGKNGFICPPEDSSALAERIKELLDSPEKRLRMGIDGQKTFHDRYTKEKWEEKLTSIFSEIVSLNK